MLDVVLHEVLEFVDGGTLLNHLQHNRQKLPWPAKLGLARDVSCAVAFLHQHRVIHADIKARERL